MEYRNRYLLKTGAMFLPLEIYELSLKCDYETIAGIIDISNQL